MLLSAFGFASGVDSGEFDHVYEIVSGNVECWPARYGCDLGSAGCSDCHCQYHGQRGQLLPAGFGLLRDRSRMLLDRVELLRAGRCLLCDRGRMLCREGRML